MRVLLINQGHTPNLGDVAINEAIAAAIKEFEDIQVEFAPFDASMRITGRNATIGKVLTKLARHNDRICEALISSRVKRILNSKKIDAAIIGGGELLHGYYKPFAYAFFHWTKELGLRGIPVCALGISGDMPKDSRMRDYYKAALIACSDVSVRDPQSLFYVRTCYGIESAHMAPDVVFSYGLTHTLPPRASKSMDDMRPTIMFVPFNLQQKYMESLGLGSQDQYCSYLLDALYREIDIRSAKRIVFASTEETDYEIIDTLFEKCSSRLKKLSVDAAIIPFGSLDEFITRLSDTDVVLSCRMHACILGLICGCDFTVIPLKEKLVVFSEEYSSACEPDDVAGESRRSINETVEMLRRRVNRIGQVVDSGK